jgi:MFS transporter, ACDE family, multidrug resistance protein
MENTEIICQILQNNKNESSTSKQKKSSELTKQKWEIVSLSSIPLVMTLGNSMLILTGAWMLTGST